MCRRVTCKTCGKPNWAGCGAHVEMVLADVPKADRCRCRESRVKPSSGPAKARAGAAPANDSALSKFREWLKK
ncbi:MAG: hypothetical protein WCC60_06395 [Ilumatobacteraceae bacterium]